MLHIQSNNFVRYRFLCISLFWERRWRLKSVANRGISCVPPCLNRHDPPAPSLRSGMISSELVENITSNEVKEEYSRDLSLPRSYEAAMEALSSLISGRKRGKKNVVLGKYSKLERMMMYVKILGLEENIAGLNIIHVAGTKGKGSTCAFSEAILRECGFRTGLFTSPHLIDVRERFRLDGTDISQEKFLQYFWECWDQLRDKVTNDLPMPPLFQFLTLLAFKIFTDEKVDVGIFEVGLGGEKDSTNVIKEPVVCGISSLGMDHMDSLGDTLGKIASHKAGILKPNVPAFTVPQLPEAMNVINERARQLRIPLEVVKPLGSQNINGLQLSLAGDHQLVNASLAVSLCKSWLRRTGNSGELLSNECHEADMPDAFLRGLSSAHLPGRAQIVYDGISKSSNTTTGDLVYYLDGAHSPESMDACARWFSKTVNGCYKSTSLKSASGDGLGEAFSKNSFSNCEMGNSDKVPKQILLFNCMEVRNPQILLPKLVRTCASSGVHFSGALFVPSISTYNKVVSGSSVTSLNMPSRDLSWQFNLQRIWEKTINGKEFDRNSMMECMKNASSDGEYYHNISGDSFRSSVVVPSLSLAIKWLRDCARENPSIRFQVLVTGSLHLVGDVLKLLRR
ncbi:folylpolyglutamate synthase isoform X1 [Beta vulgaris subsp. vulgaris]|uniref:folylpolyglutamate synthase isoform X1 n=1 Tax=Beta vulgaris subsp. vulgaris TaxID=3555 RepID=UPI00203751E2|nr:folylpolyglutamate synthase isoform X1 [Beta vulgaris subsp. vulgaris]